MNTKGINTENTGWSDFSKFSFQTALIAGIYSILVGALALFWPVAAVVVIAILFGTYLFVTGITSLIDGFSTGIPTNVRVLSVISGLLSIILAILCFQAGIVGTLWFLAIWIGISFLLRGLTVCIAAISDSFALARGWRIALGILGVIGGIVILAWPGISLVLLTQYMGAFLLLLGVFEIVTAFQIRKELKAVSA